MSAVQLAQFEQAALLSLQDQRWEIRGAYSNVKNGEFFDFTLKIMIKEQFLECFWIEIHTECFLQPRNSEQSGIYNRSFYYLLSPCACSPETLWVLFNNAYPTLNRALWNFALDGLDGYKSLAPVTRQLHYWILESVRCISGDQWKVAQTFVPGTCFWSFPLTKSSSEPEIYIVSKPLV